MAACGPILLPNGNSTPPPDPDLPPPPASTRMKTERVRATSFRGCHRGSAPFKTSPDKGIGAEGKLRKELVSGTPGEWLANDFSIRTSNVSVIDDDPTNPIPDSTGLDGANVTSTLFRCRRLVLRPFLVLLKMIAWHPFPYRFHNSSESGRLWCRNGFMAFLNWLYPTFVLVFLLYSYVYEAMACHGKLSLPTNETDNWITFTLAFWKAGDNEQKEPFFPVRCPHLVTTYILPSLLHFLVFLAGVYHFRCRQYESFFSLLEKVFIETAPYFSSAYSQKRIVRRLRVFFLFAILWVVLGVVVDVLFLFAFGLDYPGNSLVHYFFLFNANSPKWLTQWLPWALDLVGGMLQSLIYAVVVLDYASECEIVRFSVLGLEMRLQERSVPLKRAFREVLHARAKIITLNGVVGQMTSVAAVAFTGGTLVGLCLFILDEGPGLWSWLYRASFLILWTLALFVPLIQAARLNGALGNIQSLALDGRGYGYPGSTQMELDSFLSFTSHSAIRARICHVPIASAPLVVFVLTAAASLLILVQLNVVVPPKTAF